MFHGLPTHLLPFDFALSKILQALEEPKERNRPRLRAKDSRNTTSQKPRPNAGEGACAPDPRGIIHERWQRTYSDRKACTASTLAARAAGRADAITAAVRITKADPINGSTPGICASAR